MRARIAAASLSLGSSLSMVAGFVILLAVALARPFLSIGSLFVARPYAVAFGAGTFGLLVISGPTFAAVVVAAAPAQTTLPWGDITVQLFNDLQDAMITALGLLIVWMYREIPAIIVTMLKQIHADKLLYRAFYKAIALTEGALKGKTLEINTSNALIKTAVALLVQEAPALEKILGDRLHTIFAGMLAKEGMLADDASHATLDVEPAAKSAAVAGASTANPPLAAAT